MKNIKTYNQFNEGIYDSFFGSGSRTKKESIEIAIKYYKGDTYEYSFLENRNLNKSKVNIKLMEKIGNKFNLTLNKRSNLFDFNLIEDIKKFLTEIGLKVRIQENKNDIYYFFNGELSLNDLK